MFLSREPEAEAWACDAISATWPDGLLYACPPWRLLLPLLRRLSSRVDVARVVIVAPAWPAQPWWPILCPDGIHFAAQVVDVAPLTRSDFCLGPVGRPSFLTQTHWRFAAFAILWDNRTTATSPVCSQRVRDLPCPCGR